MRMNRKQSHKFLFGNWLIKTIFLLAISNFFYCSFEKPSAPTFETELSVPLISKTYEMQELVDDEDYLDIQDDGDLFFHIEREIERFYVDENLKINPMSRNYTGEIGSFKIDSPGQKRVEMKLSEIAPNLSLSHGQTIEVQPFDLVPVRKEIESFANFQEVHIDSGFAILRIENNLAFSIGSPITAKVYQTGSEAELLSAIFDQEIPPHSSKSVMVDLQGKVLTDAMTLGISGHCAGSNGDAVLIDSESSLSLLVELTECKVSEAVAKIPQQYIRRRDTIQMADSLQIQDAKIESGYFALKVKGNLPVDAFLTYSLPDFINESGQVLTDSFWVNSGGEYQQNINLAGFRMHPENFEAEQKNLRFEWVFKTRDTGDRIVTLSNDDNMSADVEMSRIQFEYVTGILSELKVEIEPYHHEIDIPSDLDSLLLDDAQMELRIQSSINFPGSSRLIIEGRNETGQVLPLYVEESIEPAPTPGELANTQIVLNKSNSQIVPFMNLLPNEIEIQGNVRLGEATWVGTIHKTDFIEGSLAITTPLALALPTQKIEVEPENLELDEDIRDQIQNRLLEGSLSGLVENHLPIAASAKIFFAQDSSLVFSQPELTVGPIDIQAAEFNRSSGYATQISQSPVDIKLSESDLALFEKPEIYVGIVFELPGSNGQIVKLHISDFIKVNLALALKVKVGPNDN